MYQGKVRVKEDKGPYLKKDMIGYIYSSWRCKREEHGIGCIHYYVIIEIDGVPQDFILYTSEVEVIKNER